MTDCDICLEPFNRSTRAVTKCYCGFTCCRSCLKTYLLSLDDPECMSASCNIVFDKKFLAGTFEKKFINNEYKLHRELVLFNRELALLPDTQLELDRIKCVKIAVAKTNNLKYKYNAVKFILKEISIMNKNSKIFYSDDFPLKCPVNSCRNIIYGIECTNCVDYIYMQYYTRNQDYVDKLCNIDNLYDLKSLCDLQTTTFIDTKQPDAVKEHFNMGLLKPLFILILNAIKINQCNEELIILNSEIDKIRIDQEETVTLEFIRKCPKDTCNGFITRELLCKLCDCYSCGECHEIKELKHKCNPETVETIKLLATDTKQCPNCSVLIFKINGCDNMYCINCKVHFKWTTLKIKMFADTHNPEYLADMLKITGKAIPRDPNDIICGRELDYIFTQELVRKCQFGLMIKNKSNNQFNRNHMVYANSEYVRNIIKCLVVMQNYNLPTYYQEPGDLTRGIRIAYLKNIISKETFQLKLQRVEKKTEKFGLMYNILHLYINCAIELLYKLESDPEKNLSTFKVEISELNKITNAELAITANAYNTVVYIINEQFIFVNIKYSKTIKYKMYSEYELDMGSDSD